MGVFYAIFIYFAAQFLASLIIIIYPRLHHWNSATSQDWLNSSVAAQFFYVLIAEALTFGAIAWFIKRQGNNLRAIGWRGLRLKDIAAALGGFAMYFIAYAVILSLVSHFVPSINVTQKQDTGFQTAHGSLSLILTFISLVVLPPIVEETVFRGFVFGGMRNKLPFIWSAVLTSLLFASAHLQFGSGHPLLWVAALDTFTLSMVLCFLREKSHSLWPGILVHGLKNGIAFLSLFILIH